MLGLRTAPKESLGVSAAEMVFGEPISIPGDMIKVPKLIEPNQTLSYLREKVGSLVPKSMVKLKPVIPYLPKDLMTSQYVFIRRDAAKVPLTKPYDGPFKVLDSNPKAFLIDMGGKEDWVSIDRLKPAHYDIEEPIKVARPIRVGRPMKNA